jgi:hypothetical protein
MVMDPAGDGDVIVGLPARDGGASETRCGPAADAAPAATGERIESAPITANCPTARHIRCRHIAVQRSSHGCDQDAVEEPERRHDSTVSEPSRV